MYLAVSPLRYFNTIIIYAIIKALSFKRYSSTILQRISDSCGAFRSACFLFDLIVWTRLALTHNIVVERKSMVTILGPDELNSLEDIIKCWLTISSGITGNE